jgi:uncharacterized damage-inducible protein DinB
MLFELQSRFQTLEAQRRAIETDVRPLDTESLQRAEPDEWSLQQIVEHLVLADGELMAATRGEGPLSAGSGPKASAARRAMVLFVMTASIPVPVPSPELVPKGDVPLDELLQRWESTRAKLRKYLESVSPEEARATPFAHPVAGAMTAEQLLRLAVVHTQYHARQIKRRLRKRG